MNYQINQALEMLQRTPAVLETLLSGLSPDFTYATEGKDTWSPYQVVGHLIHGEKTDWIPRMNIFLSNNDERKLETFDRFAQNRDSLGKSLQQLLNEFSQLRRQSLAALISANLSESDLNRTAIHPQLGQVTLRNHLSSWVVHDLGHLTQIARVMAKQYKQEVGPWTEFLTILTR